MNILETKKSKKEIFNIIKERRCFLDHFENYKVKISDSNNFEKENLIGIYKIRQYSAMRTGNNKLSQEIGALILDLEKYQENKLKLVSLLSNKYYGIFYLSENLDKVIGYLEQEIDEDKFNQLF
ncbi:enoyl-CoA hydratase [Chryseobacterium joostei]|uniref:enoyl-CoA hydratase n=1 Tax=Chryseobacterium joostei TaxID=112234 RepID=UPI003D142551